MAKRHVPGNPQLYELSEARVTDALSKSTRKERRALVAVASITACMVHVGLVPRKIEDLGIVFESTHRRAILVIGALASLYFFGAFLIHSLADLIAYRAQFHRIVEEAIAKADSLDDHQRSLRDAVDTGLRALKEGGDRVLRHALFVSRCRQAFDILLPLFLGLYAAAAAIIAAIKLAA